MKVFKKFNLFKKYYNVSSLESAYKFFQLGKFDQSLQLLQKELLQLTDNYEKASIHNNIGIIYENLNQFDKAVIEYHQSILLNPNEPSTYSNLGVIYHRLNQMENAKKMYKKAMEIEPDFVEPRFRLAQILLSEMKNDEGTRILHECVKIDPKFINAYEILTLINKDTDLGLDYADKIIGLEPYGATKGLYYKAYVYFSQKKYIEAIDIYEEIIGNEPDNPKAYVNASVLYDSMNQLDKALILIHRAFELDPKSKEVIQVLANLLHKKGRNEESLHLFKEILKKNPKSDILIYNYGKVLIKLGRRSEAIALVTESLEKYPDMKLLSVMLEEFKNPNSETEESNIEINPESLELLINEKSKMKV